MARPERKADGRAPRDAVSLDHVERDGEARPLPADQPLGPDPAGLETQVSEGARRHHRDRYDRQARHRVPARPDVLAFFDEACGTPLCEGYGMNETCIVSKNHQGADRRGSVGQGLDGIDLASTPRAACW